MTTTSDQTVTPNQDQSRIDRSATYDLKLDPDARSWTARENLANILERELLGPSRGDDEVIETAPDNLYLIGRIAPVKLQRGVEGDTDDVDPEDAPDVIDAVDEREAYGHPVVDVDEVGTDGDNDDDADDQPQKRGLMIPASMGLRFQIPDDLDAFVVRASWGVYNSMKTEEVDSRGNPVRVFRRTPKEESRRIEVADLTAGHTRTIPLEDDIKLRIDVYDELAKHRKLVEIALCNDKVTPRRIPVNAWMFQTRLYIEADGQDVFLPVADPMDPPTEADVEEFDDELRQLDLQYRNRLEFAIGRTCSVDWDVKPGARRASQVWTTWLPTIETPQTRARSMPDALLDMRRLATAEPAEIGAGLQPIINGYTEWLEGQRASAASLPEHLQDDADEAILAAERVRDQLRAGLDFLQADEEALRCFRFMNRVMADQRVQSQIAGERTTDAALSRDAARAKVLGQGPGAHSWRPFQLAFILMQLEALTHPELDRRSSDTLANVELLFFPTGGGKTEAYLGLAAYTFAIRRRQGVVETPDGPLDGRAGIAVLMRYTLRLLTAQQFQRATTLICAAELVRRDDPATWGDEPFRIGLWVGTDVSPKRYDEAEAQLVEKDGRFRHRLTVLQIQRCPWCGTKIDRSHVKARAGDRRIHVYCGDDLGECPFAEGGEVDEGVPVLTVDEEIYRLAPTFLIATVDKFARLAREGEAAALFGYVRKRCDCHGFVHDDYRPCSIKDGSKHPAKDGLPAAAVHPSTRLRPPDLIIQDELHLITGALGTTVGLFEVVIDTLCSWISSAGPVKPMIVASTATVRNASAQIRGLYGRGVTTFPPQVLDVADTYFSQEVPVDEQHPGRRYVGISTTGVRLTAAEIRVTEVLMAGAQVLIDRGGDDADPYMTLVGYFNATRELAGMARYMSDDIQTALLKGWKGSKLPLRFGALGHELNVAELTSRVSSADITRTLDQLANEFDPARDSTPGRQAMIALREQGKEVERRAAFPYDAVLATSMLQVGVDVTRLGLMVMVGQPKNTAEYIQASSRVGRYPGRPGLVVTLGNWARPRDLAHYEQFRHFHETFYARVEPLSVTPFSITAIERGIAGLLVSAARVVQAVKADGLSPENNAGRIDQEHDAIESLITRLAERAGRAGSDEVIIEVSNRLKNGIDQWSKRRQSVIETSRTLVYEKALDESKYAPLMMGAEQARDRSGTIQEVPFVIANSMREVQPEINMLVSPDPDRLFNRTPPGIRWEPASPKGDDDD